MAMAVEATVMAEADDWVVAGPADGVAVGMVRGNQAAGMGTGHKRCRRTSRLRWLAGTSCLGSNSHGPRRMVGCSPNIGVAAEMVVEMVVAGSARAACADDADDADGEGDGCEGCGSEGCGSEGCRSNLCKGLLRHSKNTRRHSRNRSHSNLIGRVRAGLLVDCAWDLAESQRCQERERFRQMSCFDLLPHLQQQDLGFPMVTAQPQAASRTTQTTGAHPRGRCLRHGPRTRESERLERLAAAVLGTGAPGWTRCA